jgi:predicted regulator of Ras-like GTPase activity (Roadblock/LC7/MglB family)
MGRGSVTRVVATAQALRDLTEISTQIETAVVLDREGTVLASTLDDERAGRLAQSALELLRAAEEHKPEDGSDLVQLDVVLGGGSVFVVSDGDRVIAATTREEPTVGLVFYDLKSCLRGLGEEEKPKPRPKAPPKARPRPRPPRPKKADEAS